MKPLLVLGLFFASLVVPAQDFLDYGWGDLVETVLYYEGTPATQWEDQSGVHWLQYRDTYLALPAAVVYAFMNDRLVMGIISCEGDHVERFRQDIRRSFGDNFTIVQDADGSWFYSGRATYISVAYQGGRTVASFASAYEADLRAMREAWPSPP